MRISFTLNKKDVSIDVQPYASLLTLLREILQIRSTKQGCDYGGCGACTVLINNQAFYSCMTPAVRVQGKQVTTVEGLMEDGELHPIQRVFQAKWAVQCGFCSPGIILSAKALLDSCENPTENDIRESIVGNLCVCTGYIKIVEAIKLAQSLKVPNESSVKKSK